MATRTFFSGAMKQTERAYFCHVFATFFVCTSSNNKQNITNMNTNKGIYRSKDRKIAGVCGGIAMYFDWDPTLVRLVYALATITTAFSGVLVYLVAWLVVPTEPFNEQQQA